MITDHQLLLPAMSPFVDPADATAIHLVNGSDPQLLNLFQQLERDGHTAILVDPLASIGDVVGELRDQAPASGYTAIHVYGHGQPGRQDLGIDPITGEALAEQRPFWRELGRLAAAEADLLLYGCDVGAGDSGRRLVQELAAITGLDVAASDDMSGPADWELEVVKGQVSHTAVDSLGKWGGSLKTISPSWMDVLSETKEKTLVDAIAGQRGQALRKAKFMGYHLTNQSGTNNNVVEALQDFWNRVADRTNGKLNMTVLASDANVPGSDNEALLGVANGRFDAVTANGPIYSGVIPEVANIMTLLFSYDDSAEGRALVNNPVFQKALLKAGEPYNWRFLTRATLNSGMRDIATIPGHPINSAADLNGFKLRIPPSTSIEQQLESLNVIPYLTPISQLDDVLISGEVWGEENPPSFIQTFNLTGITNQISLTNHLWTGFLTAINLDTWDSWPKQWRKIVLSEQRAMQAQQWDAQDALNQQIIQEAPTVYEMSVVRPDLSGINSDSEFVATRNQVIKGLTPSLRPLARAIVQGYYNGGGK